MARQKTKKHNTQTATNAYKKEQVYKKQSKTKSTKKKTNQLLLIPHSTYITIFLVSINAQFGQSYH